MQHTIEDMLANVFLLVQANRETTEMPGRSQCAIIPTPCHAKAIALGHPKLWFDPALYATNLLCEAPGWLATCAHVISSLSAGPETKRLSVREAQGNRAYSATLVYHCATGPTMVTLDAACAKSRVDPAQN